MNKVDRFMHPLLLASALALAASCAQDTSAIDKKLDRIAERLASIEGKLAAGGARPGGGGARPPEPDREKTYSMSVEGNPFKGPADAKVTIVKGYEYACFYCEKVRSTMEEIVKKYGADVRIVYKQFVVHPQTATAPALAACAAHKQGRFEQMDKLLWDKVFSSKNFDKDKMTDGQGAQRCWETAEGCPIVVGLAQELQLNIEKFKADMKGECQPAIQRDQAALRALGMSGTPGFFINGRWISGAQQIGTFVAVIDDELKKANARIAEGSPQASYYQTWVVEKGLKTLDGKTAERQ